MGNEFLLLTYKDQIKDERKRLEPQIGHLHKLHISLDEAVKRAVQTHFEKILCTFDGAVYAEAKRAVIESV